jgi:hypothetical protein
MREPRWPDASGKLAVPASAGSASGAGHSFYPAAGLVCASWPTQDTGQPPRPVASPAVGGLTVLVEVVPSARRHLRDAPGMPAAYAVDADKTERNIAIPMPSGDKSLPNRERRRHHPAFLGRGMFFSAVRSRVQVGRAALMATAHARHCSDASSPTIISPQFDRGAAARCLLLSYT